MNFYQEKIIEFLLNGPRLPGDECDEFEELVENYMEQLSSEMDEEDADIAFSFADWICDLYYDSWLKRGSQKCNEIKKFEGMLGNPTAATSNSNSINTHGTNPRLKRDYAKEEDIDILKYIVKNRKFSETKGNKLWTLMDAHEILANRSGPSMKERFRKRIAPNLTLKTLCVIYLDLL